MSKFFKSGLTPSSVSVTLAQLTKSVSQNPDAGTLLCKAVYTLSEFKDGKKTDKRIGWTYQCTVAAQGNATVFVKVVSEQAPVIEQTDFLFQSPIELSFTGFKGTWYYNASKGRLELSCKATSASRVSEHDEEVF